MSELKKWGEEAYQLLRNVGGAEVRKKRHTLILLADAALAGQPKAAVFKNRRACSQQTHYSKWIHQPDYKAAYDFLIGMATTRRDALLDEQEAEAIAHVDDSRRRLHLLSGAAVDAMEEGLTAVSVVTYVESEMGEGELVTTPDTTNRLRAARDIADRIPTLARNRKTELEVKETGPGIDAAAVAAARTKARERYEAMEE